MTLLTNKTVTATLAEPPHRSALLWCTPASNHRPATHQHGDPQATVVACPQEVLHVMAPHYVHMFEAIFSRPRPWLFGHLYLPGGSRNLGRSNYELSSGSQSPLIGTLVQVTRAVRLRDGKFLIMATAITRFKVRMVCRQAREACNIPPAVYAW